MMTARCHLSSSSWPLSHVDDHLTVSTFERMTSARSFFFLEVDAIDQLSLISPSLRSLTHTHAASLYNANNNNNMKKEEEE